MNINIPPTNIYSVYLLANLILTIVSGILMEYADKRWSNGLDAPDNLVFRAFIHPMIILLVPVSKMYGYLLGVLAGITNNESLLNKRRRSTYRNVTFIKGVILMILAAPIFMFGLISETYWSIRNWYRNR